MTPDIYFPLFENILRGNLNPLLSENTDGLHFKRRCEEQIKVHFQSTGIYKLTFPASFNLKTRYYATQITGETEAYVADMIEMIQAETNSGIRAYFRDQILDKHLTTCLMRLGEMLQAENLSIVELMNPDVVVENERKSNLYVLHLLKVCLTKAFLEIQYVLMDVVRMSMSEKQIYITLVGDLHPVHSFLKKSKAEICTKTNQELETENKKPLMASVEYYSRNELKEMLNVSDSTMLRYQQKVSFPKPCKKGKENWYSKTEIDNWIEKDLKSPNKKNNL